MFEKISIFSCTQDAFSKQVELLLGKGGRHAKKIYSQWLQKAKITDEWAEPQAKDLVKAILDLTDFSLPLCSQKKEEGSTVKFLLQYPDLLESESVLIPMEAGVTLCLSSQVGCRMGCAFCETGKMGLLRSLTADEIVKQVFYARFILGFPVRNLVFMGMGEPLDNFESLMQALDVLTDPHGLNFGPSRITVSTSGCVDQMYQLNVRAPAALNLAVSVNAPNDAIRNKLMPVNKKWNMQVLKEAMLAYCSHPRRTIFIEYVLIKDVNDSLECAEELCSYLRGLRVKVNLIPYNPQSRDRFAPPPQETTEAFLALLRKSGYRALIRHPKGQGIMAACGQLGNVQLRKKIF